MAAVANGSDAAAKEPVFDIPKTCKAAVIYDEGPNFQIKLEEVPVPEPGPEQVLIKLNATGLCYSDLHFMLNDLGLPTMSSFGCKSPGHEGAGVIVKLGPGVRTLKVGQRAGLKPIWDTCGACELCLSGDEVHCPTAIFTGLAQTGSYQEYIVSPVRYTTLIPDGVPDVVAGPIMCSASTMYRAISRAGLKPGHWACFPGGGGGVGSQGVQIAKALGYRPIVVDTGADKREHAKKLGAEAFVDFKEVENVGAEVAKVCDGLGAHGVFVTAPAAYKTAISLLGGRRSGTVVCIGLAGPGTALLEGADPFMMIMMGQTLKGSLVGSMYDTYKALELASNGKIASIVSEVIPWKDLPAGVDKLRNSKVAGRIVVDFNA